MVTRLALERSTPSCMDWRRRGISRRSRNGREVLRDEFTVRRRQGPGRWQPPNSRSASCSASCSKTDPTSRLRAEEIRQAGGSVIRWRNILQTKASGWTLLIRLLVGFVVFLPEGIQKLLFPEILGAG